MKEHTLGLVSFGPPQAISSLFMFASSSDVPSLQVLKQGGSHLFCLGGVSRLELGRGEILYYCENACTSIMVFKVLLGGYHCLRDVFSCDMLNIL